MPARLSLAAANGVLFGAYDTSEWQRSLNGLTALAALDAALPKPQSMSHPQLSFAWGVNADGSPRYQPLYPARLAADYAAGRVPMLTWLQMNGGARTDAAQIALFNNEQIIAGRHDAYIVEQFAKPAAAYGHPFAVRLNAEMNGWWEGPFSECNADGTLANGNTAGSFVRGWRHIVGLVRPIAPNVAWYWCANPVSAQLATKQPTAQAQLGRFYPGDAWADYVGCDIYNTGSAAAGSWLTFGECMEGKAGWGNTTAAILALAPGKPWLIGEWGCSPNGDKAGWITDMLASLPVRYPFVRGLCAYNVVTSSGDFSLGAPAVLAAFARGVANPAYVGGRLSAAQLGADGQPPPLYQLVNTPEVDAQLASDAAQLATLGRQLSGAQSQLATLGGQLADAQAQLTATRDQSTAASTAAAAQLADAEAQLGAAQGAYATLRGQVRDVTAGYTAWESSFVALGQAVA